MAASEAIGNLGWGAFPSTTPFGISAPPSTSVGGTTSSMVSTTLACRSISQTLRMAPVGGVVPAGAAVNVPATAPSLIGNLLVTLPAVGAHATGNFTIPFHSQGDAGGPATVIATDASLFPLGCSVPKSACVRIYLAGVASGWAIPLCPVFTSVSPFSITNATPASTVYFETLSPVPVAYTSGAGIAGLPNKVAGWTSAPPGGGPDPAPNGWYCCQQLAVAGGPQIAVPGIYCIFGDNATNNPVGDATFANISYEVVLNAPATAVYPS